MDSALVVLPEPSTLTIWWCLGSLSGIVLVIQILSGLFLSFHYVSDITLAFSSVDHITRDVIWGWILRIIHANGARLFFIAIYLHIGRGLYFSSYKFTLTWRVGVVLLIMVIATAFFGYVLPWGQISFWGATVITNIFSAIPYIGEDIVYWLWGGYSVDKATLTRFFRFHFIIPLVTVGLVLVHLLFLHSHGSRNPLGLDSSFDKVSFAPYFIFKDLVVLFIRLTCFSLVVLQAPWLFGDPENFIPANWISTPVHIQPEWYFLFAYAILRAIPRKIGGAVALLAAVIILLILPHLPFPKFKRLRFYPINQAYFWSLVRVVFLLTWIGANPVRDPYIVIRQILTFLYFRYFLRFYFLQKLWDKLLD